ncbi:MAG: glutaredoxin domain-containing protein [Candidatus Hodarchaeota archaeon]
MDFKTVQGELTKHEVKIYTISTCMWCKQLKRKLIKKKIEYSYLDIDLLDKPEKTEIISQLKKYRNILAVPMMFVNDEFIENKHIDKKIKEMIKNA